MKEDLLFCALIILFTCTLTLPICYALQKVAELKSRKSDNFKRLIL